MSSVCERCVSNGVGDGWRVFIYEGCHLSGSKWVEVERAQRWVEVCHFGSTSGPLRAQPADTSDEVGRSELPASHVASLARAGAARSEGGVHF